MLIPSIRGHRPPNRCSTPDEKEYLCRQKDAITLMAQARMNHVDEGSKRYEDGNAKQKPRKRRGGGRCGCLDLPRESTEKSRGGGGRERVCCFNPSPNLSKEDTRS